MSSKSRRKTSGPRKIEIETPPREAGKASQVPSSWKWWGGGIVLAFLAALAAYAPALHGAFVFDDEHMPFAAPNAANCPLGVWTGARPLVGITYWLNYRMGGQQPFWYHLTSLILHSIVALFVFLIVRKILEFAAIPRNRGLVTAAFCGLLFLLHPLQTEAVSYISSRSENLSLALAFAAWAVFLYRPEGPIRWLRVFAVLVLFGAGAASKEHVAVLPAILLLTDYYWNPGFSFAGIRKNWRLYGVMAAGAVAAGAFFISYLRIEQTIGFHMKQFTWYQYFFTQCRVLWMYMRLFVLPIGQCADYFIAVSRTPFEHGAIFAMIALLAAVVAAFVWRKRYPIASYGFFVALLFFAPTSSIVPIKDLAADRRVYLPMIGLLLVCAEFAVRSKVKDWRLASALAAILLVFGIVTWNRNQVWAGPLPFWADVVEKAPEQDRAHLGLGIQYYQAHRCNDAVHQLELLDGHALDDQAGYLSDYALALECAGREKDAIKVGAQAMRLRPDAASFAYQALLVAKAGDVPGAMELLDRAERANGNYIPTFIERGDILLATGATEAALEQFKRALTIDPHNPSALRAIAMITQGSRAH